MRDLTHSSAKQLHLALAVLGGLSLLAAVLIVVSTAPRPAHAGPIEPPEGYPKLSMSVKAVTPTLATTEGVTLYYTIEIRNTGAYTATGATLTDALPLGTTYNGDARSSVPTVTVTSDTLTWMGDVGFDSTVVVNFSVSVPAGFTGTVRNTAVVSHPLIARPVTVTADTTVTDKPILSIEKSSSPAKPGANKPHTYTIVVANHGQPTPPNMPITVTDRVPLSTTVLDVGPDGVSDGTTVTWTRDVSLEQGDETAFTFSVLVGDVPSGTAITNQVYRVTSPETGIVNGEPYTVTVVDPILLLSKHVWPDPPGSNREMTYTLELLNAGSLATNLVITDRVPEGVTYVRGGSASLPIVSWTLPQLDTGESARFTYTVYISDVMKVPIVNDDYAACSAEGVCWGGKVLTSVVQGPTFAPGAMLNPIAHKPGGGVGTDVTATLVLRNLGPGNALDAQATLVFRRIRVVNPGDIVVDPPRGTISEGPDCGDKCRQYIWVGDVGYGEAITFTSRELSTIGAEGANYTVTIVVTDTLGHHTTEPVTATAIGRVTQQAHLIATKSAPPVIGRGQRMTYTINVRNSALATDEPPYPFLWDVLPITGATVISDSISHGGKVQTVVLTGSVQVTMTVISWTLPAFGTGEYLYEPRSFAVQVDDDLVSGTQIVNRDYRVYWYEVEKDELLFNTGQPVTTTVKEVGLIDSYKEVTPTLALPGPGNVLTYYLHIVNSGPLSLTGVTVEDYLPWQSSTYRRDAVASAGEVTSDIVSIRWTGSVAPFSSQVVTFTALVDADYRGPITNTAVISHPGLLDEVVVHAVAYITEQPVLRITKSASPDAVKRGEQLAYTIRVTNLGQQATNLVITDTVPANTTYLTDSATGGGELKGDRVRWEKVPSLAPGESRTFGFSVIVEGGTQVINDEYGVRCAEGILTMGAPVVTQVTGGGGIYLPVVMRNYTFSQLDPPSTPHPPPGRRALHTHHPDSGEGRGRGQGVRAPDSPSAVPPRSPSRHRAFLDNPSPKTYHDHALSSPLGARLKRARDRHCTDPNGSATLTTGSRCRAHLLAPQGSFALSAWG